MIRQIDADMVAVLSFMDRRDVGEASLYELYGVCGGKIFRRWCECRNALLERGYMIAIASDGHSFQEYRITSRGENLLADIAGLIETMTAKQVASAT